MEPKRGTDEAGPELLLLGAQFTSSPHGARLARRFAVRRMAECGWPAESETASTVALLIGELTANAVHHGRVPGRDFQLCLTHDPVNDVIRIEVSDASGDRIPVGGPPGPASPEDESGRGLFLVDRLAARWGVTPRAPVGKTVWAEVTAPGRPGRQERRGVSRSDC